MVPVPQTKKVKRLQFLPSLVLGKTKSKKQVSAPGGYLKCSSGGSEPFAATALHQFASIEFRDNHYLSIPLWSGAGVQLFGGLVYDGNGALEGSDYLDSHYDVLNFNDFAMGFLPLFAMVTSGGPYTEFVEALNDVSGAKGAGYYFFVSFYVVGVLIFFNVFSAFVIDAFLSQYTEARALAHDDEADTLDQSCVEEGYRIVATRRSAQNDVYRAMFLEDDDGDDDDDDECGVIN